MAQTTNPEYILNRMRAENIRNFRIYDSDKKTVIEDETYNNLTVDDAINRVKETLSALSGLIWVELCTMARGEKASGGGNAPNKWIALNLGGGGMQGIGAQPGAMAPAAGFQQLIAEMEKRNNDKIDALQKEFKHQQEITELKRQLAEKDDSSPLKMLEPHLPAIITGIFGAKPAGIAGHPQAQATEPAEVVEAVEATADEVEFAELQLSRLLKVDPEFLNVLEKLADMAEQNPGKYQMAKTLL